MRPAVSLLLAGLLTLCASCPRDHPTTSPPAHSVNGSTTNIVQADADEVSQLREKLTKMQTAYMYDYLKAEVKQVADLLITAYRAASSVDEFAEQIESRLGGLQWWETDLRDVLGSSKRFAEMVVYLGHNSHMVVFFDRKSRELLNYVFSITFY
jgi:RNA processing factor Prp31